MITQSLTTMLDKPAMAIERLKAFEPPEGYYLAFSGGKDSQCVYHLAVMAGVKFDAHYSLTTVDPPELVNFIRSNYPDVKWERPKLSMWQLIVKNKMPPTRVARYCCRVLKEGGGSGRLVVTGIRAAESSQRSNRKMVEDCKQAGKNRRFLHPIIDWSDNDVWDFLDGNEIEHCKLYDEGHTRLGCIMCPMSSEKGMRRDAARWPKYYQAYMRAFERAKIEQRKAGRDHANCIETADDMMKWWIAGTARVGNIEDQPLFCRGGEK